MKTIELWKSRAFIGILSSLAIVVNATHMRPTPSDGLALRRELLRLSPMPPPQQAVATPAISAKANEPVERDAMFDPPPYSISRLYGPAEPPPFFVVPQQRTYLDLSAYPARRPKYETTALRSPVLPPVSVLFATNPPTSTQTNTLAMTKPPEPRVDVAQRIREQRVKENAGAPRTAETVAKQNSSTEPKTAVPTLASQKPTATAEKKHHDNFVHWLFAPHSAEGKRTGAGELQPHSPPPQHPQSRPAQNTAPARSQPQQNRPVNQSLRPVPNRQAPPPNHDPNQSHHN